MNKKNAFIKYNSTICILVPTVDLFAGRIASRESSKLRASSFDVFSESVSNSGNWDLDNSEYDGFLLDDTIFQNLRIIVAIFANWYVCMCWRAKLLDIMNRIQYLKIEKRTIIRDHS